MTATIPATEVSLRATPVAGIDLLTGRERDADQLALDIAAEFSARGATGITVATHWAQVGLLRHVSLSVQAADTAPDPAGDTVWTVLSEVAARHGGPSGLLFADRYEGQPELQAVLTDTVAAHIARSSGRLVVFPGSADLVGTVTVGHAIAASAIDRIRILAVGDAGSGAMLVTRNFVRPRWRAGHLVLELQPAAGGALVPFETANPTPCCADHD